MENSEIHTTTVDLKGLSDADREHELMWRTWFDCCFDKNGKYIEENEKVFNELMARQAQKKEQKSLTSASSSSSKQKDNSEFTF